MDTLDQLMKHQQEPHALHKQLVNAAVGIAPEVIFNVATTLASK